MFGGGGSNPYDDIVAKTTDENLTSENWELILNLCDKVIEEGDEGAHNVIAALLKRLAHRNPNVQLYALSLTDSLSKNCGIKVNKEIASRAFTQGLEKLVTDRTTHDKVRKRALSLIVEWTTEFEHDTSLGVMEDCYSTLKSKGYKFETPQEPPPPAVDDEIRRKEEEELQRVLEMSMQDRGGRDQWSQYSRAASGPSGAGSSRPSGSAAATTATSSSSAYTAPRYQGGYAPARTPSPQLQPQQPQPQRQSSNDAYTHSNASNVSANSNPLLNTAATSTPVTTATPGSPTTTATGAIVTRVKALHTFEPTEPGELAFEKGDIIKVVDRGYKDWWRGQLKGRTGIFPVNYVEPMPEPTAAQLAKEAEQEATVFAQAVNVEKLLNLLRAFDPAKDNLADNEEIQELYRSSMALRPKIVKLIDKYSQKRADLVSMNETFVRARTIFDRMMEESLARHTGIYDQPTYRPSYASGGPSMRPDSRTAGGRSGGGREYVGSPVGGIAGTGGSYGPGLYGSPVAMPQAYPEPQPQPVPSTGYPGGSMPYGYTHPQPQPPTQPQQQQQPQQQLQPGYASAPYVSQGGQSPYPTTAGGQPSQTTTTPQQQYQQAPQQQQPPTQQQPAYGQSPYSQPGYQPQQQPQPAPQAQMQPQSSIVQPQQQAQPLPQQQPLDPAQVPGQMQPGYQQTQPLPQQQPLDPAQVPAQMQPGYQQTQPQPQQQGQAPQQTQPQPQQQLASVAAQAAQATQQQQPQPTQQAAQSQQHQPQPSTQSGPPYIFDPTTTYSDPNVQAWAQYYAQGGKDLAGSVYFVSIPGLTDGNVAGTGGAGPTAATQTVGGGTGSYGAQVAQSQPEQQQQPSPQQQEHHQQGYDPHSVSYGTTSSPTSMTTNFQAHDQQRPGHQSLDMTSSINAGGSPHSANFGYSPNVASTPSWVLPKKDSPGGHSGYSARGGPGGMSDGSNGAASGAQGLAGRLAGVTLTDPGSASA